MENNITAAQMLPRPMDTYDYVFLSIELLLNVIFIIAYPVIAYICVTQRNLHINFRVLLQLANTGLLMNCLQRTILIVNRVCCIGNANTNFVLQFVLTYFLFFGTYLFTGCLVGLVLERVYASLKATSYEKKCRSCFETIVIAFLGMLPATIITVLKALNFQGTFDFILLGMEITVDTATAIGLIYILRYNQKIYNGRHDKNLELTGRYQLSENIRATTYVIPVALFDLGGRVIVICLICYSVFFTTIPLGQDTGHISHAYDITSAVKRVFFGLWLVLKNEKFVPAGKRRATVHVEPMEDEKEKHFQDLRKQWE